ncbi:MAG: hypothetical protein KKD39_08020, partial [Candidatus Altiarchaeota archaeon]|nr:hypothetical protein [Candidatus Altiarchaeota archaeon]
MMDFFLITLFIWIPGFLIAQKIFDTEESLAFAPAFTLGYMGVFFVLKAIFQIDSSYLIIYWFIPFILAGKIKGVPTSLFTVLVLAIFAGVMCSPWYHELSNTDGIYQMLAGKSFLSDKLLTLGFIDNFFQNVEYPQPFTFRPPLNAVGLGTVFTVFGFSYANA